MPESLQYDFMIEFRVISTVPRNEIAPWKPTDKYGGDHVRRYRNDFWFKSMNGLKCSHYQTESKFPIMLWFRKRSNWILICSNDRHANCLCIQKLSPFQSNGVEPSSRSKIARNFHRNRQNKKCREMKWGGIQPHIFVKNAMTWQGFEWRNRLLFTSFCSLPLNQIYRWLLDSISWLLLDWTDSRSIEFPGYSWLKLTNCHSINSKLLLVIETYW